MRLTLLAKRTVWWPTWRGWLCFAVLFGGLVVGCSRGLHPFLAVTQPAPANVLVVEGWVSDGTIQAAQTEFQSKSYDYLITTGGPIPKGAILSRYESYAEAASATLRALGFPTNRLITAPGIRTYRHRTRQSAVAAKEQLARSAIVVNGLNVVTDDTHARRSVLTYRRVFGAQTRVGVISYPSDEYDPRRWWGSSEGIKAVWPEALGWAYEWLFGS